MTFRYTADPEGAKQYGLIAEEVAEVYPELVNKSEEGQVESVQYHQLIPMLLNEAQQQQRQITGLQVANASLWATMVQMEVLAARLDRLEAGQAKSVAQR